MQSDPIQSSWLQADVIIFFLLARYSFVDYYESDENQKRFKVVAYNLVIAFNDSSGSSNYLVLKILETNISHNLITVF